MEDLVGDWKLESRSSNLEDFLACRRAHWWMRKFMNHVTHNIPHHNNFTLDPVHLTKRTHIDLGPFSHVAHTREMPLDGYFRPERTLSHEGEVGRVVETSTRKVVVEMRYEKDDEVAAVAEHQVFGDQLFVKQKCGDVTYEEVYRRMGGESS